MTEYLIADADFWAKEWQKVMANKGDQKSRIEKSIRMWNNRAESFAQSTTGEKNILRQKQILGFIENSGIDLKAMTILDIGCGPGNYTIPLAKKAAQVWALDPVAPMLDIVKTRAEKEGLENINFVNKPWEDIDLGAEGWINKFDLVFASMTPGVNDYETLEKMIKASNNYCFLSKFAGIRKNNLLEKLWEVFLNRPWSDLSMDIMYPMNYVYAMGYFPTLTFIKEKWENIQSAEQIAERFKEWLSPYLEISNEVSEKILQFASEQSENGVVKEVSEATTGMIIWHVDKN